MTPQAPPTPVRYLHALAAVAIAVTLKLLLGSLTLVESPFLILFAPVVIAGWYGGFGPAVFAAALGTVAADAFFVEPHVPFLDHALGDNLRLGVYAAEALLVAGISGALHAARERAEAAVAEGKRKEEGLRQSEERFRLLVDGVTDYAIFMVDREGRVATWNAAAERTYGYRAEEIVGQPVSRFLPAGRAAGTRTGAELAAAALEGRFEEEGWRVCRDGTRFWASVLTRPLIGSDGKLAGFVKVTRDLTERKRAAEAQAQRARQQAVVAELGQQALAGADPPALFAAAVRRVAETLGVEFSEVLELTPDGERLVLRAGVGWDPAELSRATVPAGTGSQSGYTLASRAPVVVEDVAEERRFDVSALVREAGVVSGVSVAIGSGETAFGVLGAHSRDRRPFGPDDVNFLQSVANVLAAAIAGRRAEQALREGEARLAGIIGSAMDAIITIDADQRITVFNRAAELMFRCPAREAIGGPLDRFIPERFRAAHGGQVRRFGETGETNRSMSRPGDLLGLRADGEEFPIEASISQVEVAGLKLYTVIIRDVTERKRVDAALAEQAQTLRRQAAELARLSEEAHSREIFIRDVIESLRDGLVVLDREGRVAVWNDGMARISGLPPERALGRAHVEVRHHLAGVAVGEWIARLLRGDTEEFSLEAVEHELEGRRHVHNVRGSLVRQEGRPAGAVILVEDITDRVELERAAREAERLAVLGTLSAGVAHEINNPIGIITSRIELMLEDAEQQQLPATVREDLRVLLRNALRIARIAKGLLSFARRAPSVKASIDVNAVVEDTLLLVEKQASKEGIAVRRHLAPDLPRVSGDAGQIAQVLLNLITNAREAMPEGGEVSIDTSLDPERPGWVRVRVADTGPGIPPAVQPRIFDPFFTTKPRGTGLGLSVSYGIVRDHGGLMSVESREGAGAEFSLSFPPGPSGA